jgi:hypothetical protein
MKLVASDVIFSWMVIPEVSLTRLLTRKTAVTRAKSLSLWILCISHMWRGFLRSSTTQGIDTTLGQSSELNTPLGMHSWRLGWKEIHNKWLHVSVAFLWRWQKLHWQNRQTSSRAAPWAAQTYFQRGSSIKSKLAQHAYEEGQRVIGMKPGFWKLKATAGIGNTRNQPIWCA